MADSRSMTVIHDMFRREFSAIPDLVRAVPGGDRAQAALVADHVAWMVTFLHTHHETEDRLVWPVLLNRAPARSDAVIHTMQAQHLGLAQALDRLAATAFTWRTSSSVQDRNTVVEEAGDLLPRITEHLDLEERCALHLIDAHLTANEWRTVGEEGFGGMTFRQLQIAVGMILHDATPVKAAILRDAMPLAPWLLFSVLGPRAYLHHIERLGGSRATPPPVKTSAALITRPIAS
jgi:hemerythrin-like domain-containing protein